MIADLILHGGRVYTLDPGLPCGEAIALRGNRVLLVGPDAAVLATRGPATRCLALEGRAVLPGFIDSHLHFAEWALARREVEVSDAASAEEAADRVGARAGERPAGSWIVGGRFDPNRWPGGRWPTRALLDAAAPGRPVVLSSKDMHSCWASSLALARAGIEAASPDPEGGVIERDATGAPTGILRERAMDPLWRVVPSPTVEEAAAALEAAVPLAWAAGLTSLHEIHDTPEALGLHAWQRLHRSSRPRVRVYHHLPLEHLESAIRLGVESGLGDERLRLAGVKLFADGALGSRTAHLLEPYAGTLARGVAVLPPRELLELLRRADHAGVSVSIHAIGDRANREVLDAFTTLREGDGGSRSGRRLRHRIEHVQLLHPDDLPRLARLDLIASMQPIHATSDMTMAEEHWGAERCRLAYPWRSLLESGAALCFGSDAPVEPFGVLEGIHAAVTRRRPDGSPGPDGWIPQQRISVLDAVRAYTLGGAYASGEEQLKGSLVPGKLADAVVLSTDIFTCPPDELLSTRVEATILDGVVVHSLLPSLA